MFAFVLAHNDYTHTHTHTHTYNTGNSNYGNTRSNNVKCFVTGQGPHRERQKTTCKNTTARSKVWRENKTRISVRQKEKTRAPGGYNSTKNYKNIFSNRTFNEQNDWQLTSGFARQAIATDACLSPCTSYSKTKKATRVRRPAIARYVYNILISQKHNTRVVIADANNAVITPRRWMDRYTLFGDACPVGATTVSKDDFARTPAEHNVIGYCVARVVRNDKRPDGHTRAFIVCLVRVKAGRVCYVFRALIRDDRLGLVIFPRVSKFQSAVLPRRLLLYGIFVSYNRKYLKNFFWYISTLAFCKY